MHFFKKYFLFFKKHKFIVIPTVIFLLILGFILRPKPAPQVVTQIITRHDITQSVSVSGSTTAKKMANLSFPVAGTISWVGVETGDTVTQGQIVATIDERTALKNLKAALLNYSLQRNTFDQNIANNNGIASPQDALNDNMKRILQNNQYNLDLAVNSVELQDLARQQSILSTPISGIVTRADASTIGVTATPTTIFTVVDPTSIVFNMDVDEADIGKIVAGQIVELTLDAFPDEKLKLPVDSIDFVSHKTSNGGDAFGVEVKLDNPNGFRYRIGMNGDANIIISEKHDVLTVPLSSIVSDNEVYVKKGKTYKKQTIKLGVESDTDAEVLSGLKEGDIIALDPTQVTNK